MPGTGIRELSKAPSLSVGRHHTNSQGVCTTGNGTAGLGTCSAAPLGDPFLLPLASSLWVISVCKAGLGLARASLDLQLAENAS